MDSGSEIRFQIKEEPLDPDEYEERANRTKNIVGNEFKIEVEEREAEVLQIQDEIQRTQRYLEILKYVTSYEFYDTKIDAPAEAGQPPVEAAIHPCIKSLLTPQMKEEDIPKLPVVDEEKPSDVIDQSGETLPPKENVTIVRGSYKVKHHLVIGNVSKWIPPSYREDSATHKWMLYVRDKGRDDEMGKIIKKVRYFLHESYHPHDIIDVSSAPFHLTRRGWGEFPVRVTIYFHHLNNKPIDLIHELKLDLTFSGDQKLGGETVIEANLFHDDINDLLDKEEPKAAPKKNDLISIEHNYFSTVPITDAQLTTNQMCPLLSGDYVRDSEKEILNKWNSATDGPLIDWYRKNVLQRVSKIYFFSTEGCVKWFLKRWPIVAPSHPFSTYRIAHAYAFSSVQSYVEASMGKRAAAEWYRAYKIKTFIDSLNLTPWSTKQIMMYARMHGYVFLIGKKHSTPFTDKYRNISTYTNSIDSSSNLRLLEAKLEDSFVEICEDEEPKPASPVKKTQMARVESTWINFAETASRQLGIKLGSEEVTEGVAVNAPSAVLAQVLKSFLENLLRKSYCNAWLRNQVRDPEILEVSDVLKTIVETPEFDLFTNAGLGSKNENEP